MSRPRLRQHVIAMVWQRPCRTNPIWEGLGIPQLIWDYIAAGSRATPPKRCIQTCYDFPCRDPTSNSIPSFCTMAISIVF